MISDVDALFSVLGLSEQAQTCYIALLALKTAKASEIAEATDLHRTIIYKPLEELVRMGLVSEKRVRGVKTYVPTHPELIQRIVDDRIRHAQAALPSLIEQFAETTPSRTPSIRFHADLKGIRSVLEEILTCHDRFYRVVGAFHDEAFLRALGDNYLNDWTKRRIERGVRHQTLRPPLESSHLKLDPSTYEEHPRYLREVRFVQLPKDIPMLTYLYDKKAVFISGRMGSFFAAVIESEDLFITLNAIFEMLWRIAKKTSY